MSSLEPKGEKEWGADEDGEKWPGRDVLEVQLGDLYIHWGCGGLPPRARSWGYGGSDLHDVTPDRAHKQSSVTDDKQRC